MKFNFLFLCICLCTFELSAQINTGSPAIPFGSNTSYAYGIMPTTSLPNGSQYGKSQDAGNAYNAWKGKFVQVCSNGSRVLFDDMSATVSEGIAYGMLLSAYAGDKPLFDELWKYWKATSDGKGLMNWKMSNCTSVNGSNSASDADLDAAMALIVAAKQWPSATSPYTYNNEAKTIIANIRQYDISSGQVINGDAWGTGTACRNPSYFAPAYYREFALVETSQAAFWNNCVSASTTFLNANRNATTGLVSNWADNNGTPNSCNGPNEYGYDACRNPWRMATDVLWNGATTATAASGICTKMSNWLKGSETSMKGPLSQSAGSPSQGTYWIGCFSTYALAFMGTSSTYQTNINTAYQAVANLSSTDAYFNATVRCITLFQLTGNFWKPSSGTAVVLPATPANVSATDGTSCDNSTLTWSAVSGATSYNVYKNGTKVAANTTTTSYVDANAPAIDASVTVAGYSATGCKDDFNTKTDYAIGATGKGLFWWAPKGADLGKYTLTRDSANKKLIVAVNQTLGSYTPFGVSFGDSNGDGTGTPFTADFTSDFTYNMTISNTSTSDVFVRIAAQDATGNIIDLNTATFTPVGDAWKHNIDMMVPAGGSKTLTLGTLNSQGTALTGTFTGGATATWVAGVPTLSTTFDKTQVKGFNVTVLSTKQDATYNPMPFAGTIAVTSFAIGKFTSGGSATPASYCVEAVNANGVSPQACDNGYKKICTITVPLAPATLTATDGTSCDNVSLTWAASSGATSYKIYKAGTLLSTATTTTYTDIAAPTTATQYCVEAVNTAGTSLQTCDNGYKGTNCASLPTAPTGVSATDGTLCDKASISWNPVTSATSYKVYREGTLLTTTTTTSYDDLTAPLATTTGGTMTTAGYSATGCVDDFKSKTDYAIGATGKGLFWWAPKGADLGKYTLTRDSINKKIDVVVNQTLGSYTPFGVSFGDSNGDGTGTPFTADLSGDFTYNMTITNNSADDVFIRLAAQDATGNIIDLNTSTFTPVGDAWKHNIDMKVAAFGSKTLTLGTLNSQGTALTGTFAGGATATWVAGVPTLVTTFDKTKVKGFNITVLSTLQDATYNPMPIQTNISVTAFKVGVFTPTSSGGGTPTGVSYSVEACNTLGCSPQSSDKGYKGTNCTTTPPATPTGVAATDGTSCDNVTVSWTAVATAVSYKVYKAGTLLGSTTTTSYVDAAATTTATQYCVEAINGGGASAQACDNGNKSTNCGGVAPAAPTGVSATDGTSTSNVTISWTASATATSYKIYKAGTLLGTSTTTSYVDAAASTTTTQYCVEALNASGASTQTCDNGYKGNSITTPTSPTGLTATDGTLCDKATISWNAVASATSYKIYREGTLLTTTTATSYDDLTAPLATTTGGSTTTAGYSTTGCIDDFKTKTDYAIGATGKGLFWWTPKGADLGKYTLTRDSINKKIDVVVNQTLGSYTPFGVSFGDSNGDGTGTPFTADLSGDFTYSMTISNNSADDVFVRLAAQDATGNIIDLNTSTFTPVGDAWKHNIDMKVPAFGSKTLTIGTLNSQSTALTGTFAGGATATWVAGVPTLVTTFDKTKVKGFNITVLSTLQDATYNPMPIQTNISVTAFKVGVFTPTSTGGTTGTGVTYSVEACNTAGCSPQATDKGFKGANCTGIAPTTPTNVTATDGTSCDNVTVSWTAVSTATLYKVYKAGTLVGSTSSTSYVDLSASTTSSQYCVEAINGAGTSTQACNTGYKNVCSGIADSKGASINTISIYPNPASSIITIDNCIENSVIAVYDMIGQQVFTGMTESNQMSINTSTLKAGLYFVSIKSNNETITKKFIKN